VILLSSDRYRWAEVSYRATAENGPLPLAVQLWMLLSGPWPDAVSRPACAGPAGGWSGYAHHFIAYFEGTGDLYLCEGAAHARLLDERGPAGHLGDNVLRLTRQDGVRRFTVTFPRLDRGQAEIFDALRRQYEVTRVLARPR
jgi:hypothetical protein